MSLVDYRAAPSNSPRSRPDIEEAEELARTFEMDCGKIRDLLLDLAMAFEKGADAQVLTILQKLAAWSGPRLRYQEEAVFPALTPLLGRRYIEEVRSGHDRTIEILGVLREQVSSVALTQAEMGEAAMLVRSLLPHLSASFSLALMLERLPGETATVIIDARNRAIHDGLDLFEWRRRLHPLRVE